MKHNKIYIIRKHKGITLIELLITLAILGIVLTTIFSLNLFGLRTFAQSRDRAENQFEVRMPADFIAKQIRYADSMEILSTVPASTPAGAHEIFLDSGQLIYREYGSAAVIIGTQGVSDYSLDMQIKSGTTNVIQYTIGKDGTNQFDLLTDVIVLNLSSNGIEGNQQGIGVRYYTDTADNVVPVSITSLVNPPTQFASVGTVVSMPIRVDANMSDGTSRQVSVRWTPSSIDTSVPGTYTSTGRVVGYAGTTSLTVFIGSYTISGIDNVNVTLNQGESFSMPSTVVATLTDGINTFTQNINVTWDNVIDASTVGVFVAEGTVEDWGNPVLLTVTVEAAAHIVSINSSLTNTVMQGTSFSLPNEVLATYSDGNIQNVPVTWLPATLSTASAGTFSTIGSVSGYGTITYQLIVNSNKLSITSLAWISLKSTGQKEGVGFINGTGDSTAVFRKSDGSTIATYVIPSTGEGNFTVNTKQLHDVILRKVGWQDSDPLIPIMVVP